MKHHMLMKHTKLLAMYVVHKREGPKESAVGNPGEVMPEEADKTAEVEAR